MRRMTQYYTQIVSQPTRVTLSSSTLIDHIITNKKTLKSKVLQTPKISDLCIIELKVQCSWRSKGEKKNIVKRDYKKQRCLSNTM